MKYTAIALLFGASLLAAWWRSARRPPDEPAGGLLALAFLGIAVVATLTGVMQASALVGKAGQAITERTAQGAGFLWIAFGAFMCFFTTLNFAPDSEDWGPVHGLLLVGGPTACLVLLMWVFEVP